MPKLGVLASYGVLMCIVSAPTVHAADPSVTIALYAPQQKESPVQIVGFKYGDRADEVQLEVSNTSDKAVVAIKVVSVVLGPSGCPTEKPETLISGGSRYPITIAAHTKGSTSRTPRTANTAQADAPIHGHFLLVGAKNRGASEYVHVQVGVVEVDFADGTVWKRPDGRPSGPFDRALLDADRVTCPDAASVRKALAAVTQVHLSMDFKFKEPSNGMPTEPDSVPRLLFSCTLQGSSAVCPWPTERN